MAPFEREDLNRWVRATPVFAEDSLDFVPLDDVVLRNREPALPPAAEIPRSGSFEESERERRLLNDEREIFTAYYLSVLSIALQRHRHEHGEFPEHLSQLEGFHPQLLELVTTDQFSGNDFHWYPHGLPGPLFLAERRIRAHQPLLFSIGRDQRFLQLENLATWIEDWVEPDDPNRAAYHDGRIESQRPFVSSLAVRWEPPLVPAILNYANGTADEVATAILGESAWPEMLRRRWSSPEEEPVD
jgi:hypothetical protein